MTAAAAIWAAGRGCADLVAAVRVVAAGDVLVVRGPEDSLDEAMEEMARQQVGRLPIVDAAGRILGVVTLSSRTPGRFGEADLELAKELARRASVAVDNALWHDRVADPAWRSPCRGSDRPGGEGASHPSVGRAGRSSRPEGGPCRSGIDDTEGAAASLSGPSPMCYRPGPATPSDCHQWS